MAFTQTNTAPAQSNDSWKAQAFINISLPGANGKDRKLGAIALHTNKVAEKSLMEWLQADPANVQKLLGKMKLDFQLATGTETSGFALD